MLGEKKIANLRRGHGTEEWPLIGTLWSRDRQPQAEAIASRGNYEPHHRQVDYTRYYDPAWAKQEIEKIFSKSWLYACREEDMPEVGDRVPFDVGPLSFFIVRSKLDEFKGFYNACRHRGTALCVKAESGTKIRCPYHAWEWKLDGRLDLIPGHWDFTEVTRQNGSLREVKVGHWGGYIFINADPKAGPLEEALQVLPAHFKEFAPESRYTAARFRKTVLANWKIAQEAFMESYHIAGTHPEAIPYAGDSQTQYDIWSSGRGHVGRLASPSAIPSMQAGPEASLLGAAQMFTLGQRDWHYPSVPLPEFDTSKDLRAQAADWHRQAMERVYGHHLDLPDAVMLDSLLYFMFPHAGFWLSEPLPFSYQFLPHATDPERSTFEVRMLLPCPKGQKRPPAAPLIEVGTDERVVDKVPAFGILGYIFDQDMTNMPLIQKGVRAADPAAHHSLLGSYQEMMIQHWNELYDQYGMT